MADLDVLTVRLEADIAAFQSQLDRARAQLTSFAGKAEPAAAATEKIGKVATRSLPGLGRLGNALENVATRAAGMPGILGKVVDVFGSFAIGSGPMVLAFAGLAGIAVLFNKVTESARETKKAAEDAMKAVTNTWLGRQTQGDIDLIQQQRDIGAQLDAQTRKVQRATDARENKDYLAKLNAELVRLQTAYDQATELLDSRRADRQQEAAERAARANEKSANDAAAAWKRAYSEIEAAAKQFEQTHPPLSQIAAHRGDTEGRFSGPFFVPELKPLKASADALTNTFKKLDQQVGMLPRGAGPVGGGPGFVGNVWNNISGLLNPTMIASNIAGGFITSGISFAIGGLAKLGKSILGIGNDAQIAAKQFQIAMGNFQDAITDVVGTDAEKAFIRGRQQIESLLQGALGQFVDLSAFKSFEEVIKFFKDTLFGIRDLPQSESFKAFTAALELAEVLFADLNNEIANTVSELRNVPEGFKIALARFSASDAMLPTAVGAGVRGGGLIVNGNITVVANNTDEIVANIRRRQFQRTGTAAGPLLAT